MKTAQRRAAMKTIKRFRGISYFLAGALAASMLMMWLFSTPQAVADQYSCIRQDLDAQGMTGNIPDPEFTITYNIPECYRNNGYSVTRVYIYGDQVAVHYSRSG